MAHLEYVLDLYRPEDIYIPYHYHYCYEIVFYANGNGFSNWNPTTKAPYSDEFFNFIQADDTTKELVHLPFEKNSMIFYPPYTFHDEKHIKGGDIFAIGFLTDEALDLDKSIYHELPIEIVNYIQLIAQEYRRKREGYLTAINSLIDLLIIELSRMEKKQEKVQTSLETVKKYIDNYYMTDIKVADIAKMSFYTTDHFIRVFKKEFGIHPKQYILKLRLEESLRELQNTDLPICDIAYRVGYKSNADFSSFIKKETGKSPSKIRREASQI